MNCVFNDENNCNFQDVSSHLNKWHRICDIDRCYLKGLLDHFEAPIRAAFVVKKVNISCIKVQVSSRIKNDIKKNKNTNGEYNIRLLLLNIETQNRDKSESFTLK